MDPLGFAELGATSDVGCLLSRAEAGGISLREFCRLGLPVLGPRTGGSLELCFPETSHLFDPAAPAAEIAEVLDSLARDRDLLAQEEPGLGEAARGRLGPRRRGAGGNPLGKAPHRDHGPC